MRRFACISILIMGMILKTIRIPYLVSYLFVGMEISLNELLSNWKIPVVGTIIQIAVKVGIIFLLGTFLDWKFIRVLLIGFAISINSTAVVIKNFLMNGIINPQII